MRNLFTVLTLFVLAAGSAAASEKTDVMVPVLQFVDGFNTDDTKKAAAACTDEMSIIDDFPPHEWHGPGALSKWLADYEVDAKKNVITDGRLALGKPRHIDVTGNRAYVVIPTNYAYKMKGKRIPWPSISFSGQTKLLRLSQIRL